MEQNYNIVWIWSLRQRIKYNAKFDRLIFVNTKLHLAKLLHKAENMINE